ncbi:cell division cycle protein 123 family protein, putative [Entamoeba nuttalli P19]|uniref:Cell division cycle protein 123 family protein, putative n=1 Tax=Entamoeba nuttalli (strain P19) TaxID=1076696 RepID=K2HPV0_ENTNP|nr:cell division cycle protein 123 family protein, putative [Entamoeba nuttalli P19]EKE37930.1 cell division cycle protein 123 family protein, putative [Entamoeba nuttalli P19]|eukprot:XP_008859739.1 cell division cycle protein 123 family protein, putative [Entamoeba nuttalli P19]
MKPSTVQSLFHSILIEGEVVELDEECITEIEGDVKSNFTWSGIEEIKEEEEKEKVFEKKEKEEKQKKENWKSEIEWFNQIIERNVQLYGGVFLKINGKALVDAEWMNGSLKVCNGNEGMMLLQGSERAQELIEKHRQEGKTNELEIRKFEEIRISDEFRCFVVHKELIIISQRYNDAYEVKIQERKKEIIKKVNELFEIIKNHHFSDSYTFDVVINNKIKVIGFDEMNERSFEGMTFNKEELMLNAKDINVVKPLLKFVEDSQHIIPTVKQFYGIPEEFYDEKVLNTFLTNPSKLTSFYYLGLNCEFLKLNNSKINFEFLILNELIHFITFQF